MLTPRRVALLCSAPFVLLATWNLWTPYSFWIDELDAVLAAGGSWPHLAITLSDDVHPPLYLLVLRPWIALAGAGEAATRTLSFACALAALGVFAAAAAREGRAFAAAATLFFAGSWLFPYYAQGTRSYALLLLAGTAATVTDRRRAAAPADDGRGPWLALLVLLSLVHYFGLLWAGVLLLGDLWRVRRQGRAAIVARVMAGTLMLAWPIGHLAFGGVGEWTGGNFWIRVNGIAATVRVFTMAILEPPRLQAVSRAPALGLALVWCLGALAAVAAGARLAPARGRREIGALAARMAAAVGIAALIDLHTPISTQRNYIVLLPAAALIAGHATQALWIAAARHAGRAAVALLVVGYASVSGARAVQAMRDRWAPRENWKGLVERVEAAGTCRPHCWVVAGGRGLGYYARASTAVPIAANELMQRGAADARPILGFHIAGAELARLRRHHGEWRCLEPPQSRRRTVVILLPPDAAAPPGLRPCN